LLWHMTYVFNYVFNEANSSSREVDGDIDPTVRTHPKSQEWKSKAPTQTSVREGGSKGTQVKATWFYNKGHAVVTFRHGQVINADLMDPADPWRCHWLPSPETPASKKAE
jgi:hypothetical protein